MPDKNDKQLGGGAQTAPARKPAESPDERKKALKEGGIRMQLMYIQQALSAPKDQENEERKFQYRSVEGILAAVKPLLSECGCTLTFSESITETGQGVYVMSTARLENLAGEERSTTAFAREDTRLPGMCSAQISGSCISYARKYAAGGLFAIDNSRLVDPIELDSFSPSAVEEIKRAEDQGALIDGPVPATATARPILRAGQIDGKWDEEVERVRAWKGTEEEYLQDLASRWIVLAEDRLALLSRRKEPFAE